MRFVRKIVPFLIIIFLAIVLFNKTLILPSGKMIYGGDIYDAYFYWKGYLYDSVRSGIIPFWNPYNFSGTPFLSHPNMNIFYPLNWIFIIFPPNSSFSFYFFIHIVIAGFSMYYLSRIYTNRWGALFSAITYAFGGFFAARVYAGHLEYVDAASWVPLVFALCRNFINQRSLKKFLLSVLGFSVIILCGNELFLLFALILIFLYTICFCIVQILRKKKLKSFILIPILPLLALSFSFGLTAIEVLPRMQFIALSLRSLGIPYSMAAIGSLPFDGLKLFINPFYWGSPFPEKYTYHGLWPNMFEYTHYVGIIPLILIAVLLILFILSPVIKRLGKIKYPKEALFFLFIAIPVFLLISFGYYLKPNIHELLWQYTPLYKGIRFPARHLFGVALCISLVSGITFGLIKSKIAKIIILLVIVVDLFSVNRNFIRTSDYPSKTFDKKLIGLFKDDKDLYRVMPDFPVTAGARRDLDFGASAINRIYSTSDYNSMILRGYYDFIDLSNKAAQSSILYYNVEIPLPNPWSPYIDFLNVKYVISDRWGDFIGNNTYGKYVKVLETDKYSVYKNLTYLKRFNLVANARIFDTKEVLEKTMRNENVDLSKTVLFLKNDIRDLKTNLDCQAKETGKVSVLTYSPNDILLEVDAKCDGILSTSEVYYPGWKAQVDGKNTKVYLSNTAFRSIYIPKGIHKIRLYYSPDIFYIGAVMSGIFVIIAVLIYKKSHKKNE